MLAELAELDEFAAGVGGRGPFFGVRTIDFAGGASAGAGDEVEEDDASASAAGDEVAGSFADGDAIADDPEVVVNARSARRRPRNIGRHPW